MCTDKISALERSRSKAEKEKSMEQAGERALEMLSRIDSPLISTIAQRRAGRSRPLVMIADDDQLVRMLAGSVLREDYDVAFAQDGLGALKEFVASAPDVLFLDIGMPDMSGHEVLEIIFQIDPGAYVIMFSGRKDQANIMRALEAGAQGFLGKPFTREKLCRHVEKSPFIQTRKGKEGRHESATG